MIRRALIASMSTVLLGLGSLLTGPELGAQRLRDARAGISMPGFSNPALSTVPHTKPALPKDGTGKSPILAGVLSYPIPGVGSFYAGNYRHGSVHLLVHVGSFLLLTTTPKCPVGPNNPDQIICPQNAVTLPLLATVLVANDIWSIFTAVSDAKRTRTQKPGPVGGDAANVNEGKADFVPEVP